MEFIEICVGVKTVEKYSWLYKLYISQQPYFSPEDGGSMCPPKFWYPPTSPNRVATQKSNINIFTAMRTQNLTVQLLLKFINRRYQSYMLTQCPLSFHRNIFTDNLFQAAFQQVCTSTYSHSYYPVSG
jgi:hypothetical protein